MTSKQMPGLNSERGETVDMIGCAGESAVRA